MLCSGKRRIIKKKEGVLQKMGYTNSPLVDYTKISPNKTVDRNHTIDTITIHCVVGQVTVERLGEIFSSPSIQEVSCHTMLKFLQ